jgi:hypothetical protein
LRPADVDNGVAPPADTLETFDEQATRGYHSADP